VAPAARTDPEGPGSGEFNQQSGATACAACRARRSGRTRHHHQRRGRCRWKMDEPAMEARSRDGRRRIDWPAQDRQSTAAPLRGGDGGAHLRQKTATEAGNRCSPRWADESMEPIGVAAGGGAGNALARELLHRRCRGAGRRGFRDSRRVAGTNQGTMRAAFGRGNWGGISHRFNLSHRRGRRPGARRPFGRRAAL